MRFVDELRLLQFYRNASFISINSECLEKQVYHAKLVSLLFRKNH